MNMELAVQSTWRAWSRQQQQQLEAGSISSTTQQPRGVGPDEDDIDDIDMHESIDPGEDDIDMHDGIDADEDAVGELPHLPYKDDVTVNSNTQCEMIKIQNKMD